MRRILLVLAAVAVLSLGAGQVEAGTFTITVDATALTTESNSVWGLGGLGPDRIETFTSVASGDYTFASSNPHGTFVFTVDSSGNIATGSLPSYASAAGGTLTVRGFDFTIDARQVLPQKLALWGHGDVGSDGIEQFTACPGGLTCAYSNFAKFVFTLEDDGTLTYDTVPAQFLSGAGTSTLVVEGFSVIFDARGLDATYTWNIPNIGNYATTPPKTLRMIPGSYNFVHRVWAERFTFDIDGGGLFRELPASFKGEVVSGEGTSRLLIGLSYTTTVLQPVNADGSSIFKAGRTIPVKLEVRDQDGALALGVGVHLALYKLSDAVMGSDVEVDPVASGSANEGDLFRYDEDNEIYVFNLSTKTLGPGTYRLEFVIDGTSWGTVLLSLRP